ncbi:sensor domain-containing diguanylate cyclase [Deltaproteobacteria bacterium]|nr:sensor domain-containing diguanylate cyclase [Deltaproteobacteria bacterium]
MLDQYRYGNLNLLKKVLWPYILLLLMLAMAISLGSSMLLQGRLIESTQHRLIHIQKQVYGDFKKLEQLLDQNSSNAIQQRPATVKEIEKTLLPSGQQIAVTISTYDNPDLSPQLKELLAKASPRKTAYISAIHDPAHGQTLVAAQQLDAERYLILQHPVGRDYLDELAKRYESHFYLLNQQGELIDSNTEAGDYIPGLSETELSQMRSGAPLITVTDSPDTHLVSYSPLPLGHDGIFLLGTAQSLSDVESLILNHRFYLLGIIGLSLLICITLFRSLLIRLFSPLNALMEVHEKVKSGDRNARIDIEKNNRSQLVQLCIACNQLLDLSSENDKKIEEMTEQLSKVDDLKAHNQHLRKTNLELETRTVNLKEQNQELSALFKIIQTMTSSLDLQLLYERILQTLKETLNCSTCVLYIFQHGSDTLKAVKVQGLYGIDLKSITVELGKNLAGETALNQKLGYLPDLSTSDDKTSYANEVISEGSLLSVPLTVQNRLIGVINLHQLSCDAFSKTSQQIAQAIASHASIAIENAWLFEKTKTLSATDELTGLSNRRQFQEYLLRELAQSRRHQNSFSILMIDIDHFKLYNDHHGHLKGDIVLKKVASMLLQNTRGVDLVARFGGEEFVLLLPKSDKDSSLAVADKLRLCIEKESFSGAENSQPGQRLTISIGVSHFPGDSSDVYDLMNLADTALYEAKKQGRNKCIGWSADLHIETNEADNKKAET